MPYKHVFGPNKGMVTNAPPAGIEPQASPYIKGMFIRDGEVRSDFGYVGFPKVTTLDSNVVLYASFDGVDAATAFTAESSQVATFGGTAQIDTAQSVFGGSSLLLDGNSDYITFPTSASYAFGTGDFTFKARIRLVALPGADTHFVVFNRYEDNVNYWNLSLYGAVGGSNPIMPHIVGNLNGVSMNHSTTIPALVINTWYDIAWVRSGNTLYFFLDGVRYEASSPMTEDIIALNAPLCVGAEGAVSPGRFFNGWIDEVIIKNEAEDISTYGVSASALSLTRTKTNLLNGSVLKIDTFYKADGLGYLIALTTTGAYQYNTTTQTWDCITKGTIVDDCETAWTVLTTILDYMEYASDATAQTAYVTNSGQANLSNADIDDEDMNSIAEWTIQDVGDGETVVYGWAGEYSARFFTGTVSGDWAKMTQDVGTFGNRTVFSLKLYHARLGTLASGNFNINFCNGSTMVDIAFATDGIFVHDGITYNEVGSNLVTIETNQEWTFDVNWTAATVNVYLNEVLQASNVDCSKASAVTNGTVTFCQDVQTTDYFVTYMHWFKAGSNLLTLLQVYSESTIKNQGSYSLKGFATYTALTTSLNKTLTYTIGSPINLTGKQVAYFDIYASRTGANIKIGFHDSGGTTTEVTPTIATANTWQSVTLDLSAVSDANKDAIDQIIITVVNASAANTFYLDNMRAMVYATATADTSVKLRGTYSSKIVLPTTFTTGIVATFAFAAVDCTAATALHFWVYSGIATAAGDLKVGISETSALGAAVLYFNVPALTANTWTPCCVAGTFTGYNAVISVGLNVVVDNGAQTVYLDDIVAVTKFTGDADNRFSFTTMNDTLVVTNGVDQPQKYTGSGKFTSLTTTLAAGSITTSEVCFTMKDHLFLMNNTENAVDCPQRVSWTNIGSLEDWTAGTAGYQDLTDDVSWVVGVALLSENNAIIYKERSIVSMTWVGGHTPFRFRTMVIGTGALSKDSLDSGSGEQLVVGPDVTYAYKGTLDIDIIDDKIKRTMYGRLNKAYANRIFVIYVEEDDEFQIWLPTASEYPDEVWCTNVIEETWYRKIRTMTTVGYYQEQSSLTIGDLVGTIGDQNWTFGDALTKAYSPITLCGDASGYVYKLDKLTLNNNGAAIEKEFQTPDFVLPDSPDYMNKFMRVTQLIYEIYGQSVTTTYSIDGGISWLPTQGGGTNTVTLVSIAGDYQQDFDTVCKKIRFKFYNNTLNSGFNLRYYGFRWEVRSGRK